MFFISAFAIYKNYRNNINDIQNNYMETNAEITFIGRTGTGIRAQTLLGVTYYYENKKYTGHIKRGYKNEGYYNKGDIIKIYINKNNVDEIK
jgi:hypothetical protein